MEHLVKPLRQAKNLSIVEVHLADPKDSYTESPGVLAGLEAWKAGLVDVLKNSPSKDRKFLRWNVAQVCQAPSDNCYVREVVEAEELEVLTKPSQ